MPSIDSTKINTRLLGEKEFLYAFLTIGQTAGISSGDPVRFAFVQESSSQHGVTLNPATYTFTLAPNSTYILKGACVTTHTNLGLFQYRWLDVDTSLYIAASTYGKVLTPTYNNHQTSQPFSYAVYKTGNTEAQVQLRIQSTSNLQSIDATGTFAYIEKIQDSVPVVYKTDYWDDLRFPATGVNPPGQASDPTWDVSNIGWAFLPGATNSLQMIGQLPHSYKEGTDLRAHLHWEPSNTDVGNVLWRMSYRWRNNGEVAVALTDVDITIPANGTTFALQLDAFAGISKSNALISSILDMQLSRIGGDGTDTFTGDAILKEFDIHYQLDSAGSLSEYTKI